MSKPMTRAYSKTTQEALELLGQLIRLGRIERKMTAGEMAERANISRDLLQRIERGNPGSSIGAAFEVATLAGISLFEAGPPTLSDQRKATQGKITLLPRRVVRRTVNDDF